MREVQTGPKIIVENVLPLLGHWRMVSVLVFSDKDGKPYRTGVVKESTDFSQRFGNLATGVVVWPRFCLHRPPFNQL